MKSPLSLFLNSKTKILSTVSAMIISAGCATTSPVTGDKPDPKQAERSRIFFDGMSWTSATEVSGSCSDSTAGTAKDWHDLIPLANACVHKRDWKTLENIGNALSRSDLDSPWGAYYLSVSADEMGEHARAEWMIDLAQKKSDGKNGLFAYQRARIYSHAAFSGHTQKAVGEMQRAVALAPELIDGHLFLGEIFQRDLQYDDAARSFKAALDHDGSSYRGLTGLAEVEIAQGHLQAAAEHYERALSVDRSQLEVWQRLAFVYESMKTADVSVLTTYKGLRTAIRVGAVKQRPDFDLDGKIKVLEAAVLKAGQPVTASAQEESVQREPARSRK